MTRANLDSLPESWRAQILRQILRQIDESEAGRHRPPSRTQTAPRDFAQDATPGKKPRVSRARSRRRSHGAGNGLPGPCRKPVSGLEERFWAWAKTTTGCVRECRFCPPRRWRFDFAWPAKRVAVEIEGGAWTRGRHTRGSGFVGDIEKYNSAVLAGWRVLRFTGSHLKDMESVAEHVTELLNRLP